MKRFVVSGIKMPVRHCEDEVLEKASNILKKCGCTPAGLTIYKKSLDARRKGDIHFLYSVCAEVEKMPEGVCADNVRELDNKTLLSIENLRNIKGTTKNVVVVGSGPCGLFAAYILSGCGVKVTVVERGSDVDRRTEAVKRFWNGGSLDPNTNIQFGEGGAGTFSDGKLSVLSGKGRTVG